MDEAVRLLAAHPELPIGEIVTHTYPLTEWRQAMRTVLRREEPSGAIKARLRSITGELRQRPDRMRSYACRTEI